jgi:AP-1 complex subunit mu
MSDLHASFYLAEQDVEKRAPITVKYEIPYFTVSGIQVRYLKIVEKSGYQALPWVRYITQNGDDYRYVILPINLCMIFSAFIPLHVNTITNPIFVTNSLRTALEKGSAPIVPM